MTGTNTVRAVAIVGCLLVLGVGLPAVAAGELPGSADTVGAATATPAPTDAPWDGSRTNPVATNRSNASDGAGENATDESPANGTSVAIDASGLHDRNVTGDGVRVAVINSVGGSNVDADVVATHTMGDSELPDDFPNHVARRVNEVAPGAELVLYEVNRSTAARVAALNHSVTEADADVVLYGPDASHRGPHDGSSRVARAIDDAVAADVPVVVSAGNDAGGALWRGPYNDSDGDGVHEFPNGDERMEIRWNDTFAQSVTLTWDDWPRTDEDYRLEVDPYTCWGCRPDGSSSTPVRTRSYFAEDLSDLPTAQERHTLRIHGQNATEGRMLTVRAPIWRGTQLTPSTQRGTVPLAATADRAVVVGGVDGETGHLAGHSGRGPTDDGERRPHVVAPTGIPGASDPFGTQLAAARTTGVVALVLQSNESATPAHVRRALTETARPVQGDEPNDATGHGLVDASAAVAFTNESDGGATPPENATGEVPTNETDAGVTINASGLHDRNVTGDGVRVAVIDHAFGDSGSYTGAVVASHEVTPAGGYEFTGTGTAQSVHVVAPDAELVLYRANESASARAEAVRRAVSEANADVVVLGDRVPLLGPRDGSSELATAIDDAAAAGVPVFAGSGIHGNGSLWRGRYNDSDGDGTHEFADGSETMRVDWNPQSDQTVWLQWNEWPNASTDHGLSIDPHGSCFFSPCSVADQPDDAPVRFRTFYATGLTHTKTPSDVHDLQIHGPENVTEGRVLTVYATGWRTQLTPSTREGSLSLAATADRAIVVGGVDRADGSPVPLSSRGPTVDGDRRPHVAAPTNVSVPFSGGPIRSYSTSIAAARAAGTAALILQANESATPAHVRRTLTETARPVQGDEPNNATGHGLVDASAAVAYTNRSSANRSNGTEEPGPPAWCDCDRNLSDPDDDGVYEDLNGNDRIDSDDVVEYFEHYDEPWMADDAGYFDLNGNDRTDADDVVVLFESL